MLAVAGAAAIEALETDIKPSRIVLQQMRSQLASARRDKEYTA